MNDQFSNQAASEPDRHLRELFQRRLEAIGDLSTGAKIQILPIRYKPASGGEISIDLSSSFLFGRSGICAHTGMLRELAVNPQGPSIGY